MFHKKLITKRLCSEENGGSPCQTGPRIFLNFRFFCRHFSNWCFGRLTYLLNGSHGYEIYGAVNGESRCSLVDWW